MTDAGEALARAIAAKDAEGLTALLSPTVDFQALTPSRIWQASTADEVVDKIIFGQWFEAEDFVDELVEVESATVGDTSRVGYLLKTRNNDGSFLVGQQAFYRMDNDRISWMRLVCSGWRPLT